MSSITACFRDFQEEFQEITFPAPFTGEHFLEMKRQVCERVGDAEANLFWKGESNVEPCGEYAITRAIRCPKDLDCAIKHAEQRAKKDDEDPWMHIVVERNVPHFKRRTDKLKREPLVHEGVACDGCLESNFPGFRYKCMECANFDLCDACYKADNFEDVNLNHTRDHHMRRIELSYLTDSSTAMRRAYRTVVPCEYCDEKGFLTADYAEHVKKCHKEPEEKDMEQNDRDVDPSFKSMLTELWYDLKEQKAELAGREKAFEATKKAVHQKEMQMRALESSVSMEKRHALLISADNTNKESNLKEWEKVLRSRDTRLKGKEDIVAAKEADLNMKEKDFEERKRALDEKERELSVREEAVANHDATSSSEPAFVLLREKVEKKEEYMNSREMALAALQNDLIEKERELRARKDAVVMGQNYALEIQERARNTENVAERELWVKDREEAATVKERALAAREALTGKVVDDHLPSRWNHSPMDGSQVSGLHFSYPISDKFGIPEPMTVRANRPCPLNASIYYFEVGVNNSDGFMGIGFTKESVSLRRLPGWDAQSYGYHGDDGKAYSLPERTTFSRGVEYGPTYGTGDVIGCGLNFIEKIIFFTKNGVNLGTAFTLTDSLNGFYPTVGLLMRGAVVEANFGQRPFVYNIAEEHERDMKTERSDNGNEDEAVPLNEADEEEAKKEDDIVEDVVDVNEADYDSDSSYENIDMVFEPGYELE